MKTIRKNFPASECRVCNFVAHAVSARKGSALTLAIMVVVMLVIAGLGMLEIGLQARIYAARTSDRIAAQNAADAGLTAALWTLNRNVQTRYYSQTLPEQKSRPLANCHATYSYEVMIPTGSIFHTETYGDSADGGDDGSVYAFAAKLPFAYRYVIKSVGRADDAEKVLYASVKLEGLFEYALLSRGDLLMAPNTLITGYNSADPADTLFDVKIGTTSTEQDAVSLSPGTLVEADVFVGVGGNPEEVVKDGGTVEGGKFALTESISFPTMTPPPLQYVGTSINTKGETVTLGPSDSGIYRGIDLRSKSGAPGVLEITGGEVVLHIEDKIYLGNDTDFIIRNGASLTLYVDGDIIAGNAAGFSNENTPVDTLTIFGTAAEEQSFELKAKTDVFGVVYAPNADLVLYPKAEFYGAIAADSISIKSNAVFYYDEALGNVGPADQGVRFVIEKWWE